MCSKTVLGNIPPEELPMYRAHTQGLLRRYFRMALELGRLPSLVGREIFRARVTSCRATTFEDLVIFVTDVEHALGLLGEDAQQVIARVLFQEYTVTEASRELGWSERATRIRLANAIDRLSRILLERGLLRPFPLHEKSCQEAKTCHFGASC